MKPSIIKERNTFIERTLNYISVSQTEPQAKPQAKPKAEPKAKP